MKELIIAFAGNPNVGKTALINSLSGAKLKIGNWPGVTVEKKEAELTYNGVKIKLVDLPGIYSLSPYTIEEKIARDFLLEEKIDAIINVIDATNLERNLYLTSQLLDLEIPTVIALNMWDEFEDKGYRLDIEKFEQAINAKVITTVATKGKGVNKLLKAIISTSEKQNKPNFLKLSQKIEESIEELINYIPEDFQLPKRWTALKLLEKDEYFYERMEKKDLLGKLPREEIIDDVRKRLEKYFGEDIGTLIPEERYGGVNSIVKNVLRRPVERKRELTEILDSIFLNRMLGIPIFLLLLYLVFLFTFNGSGPFIDWTDGFINGYIGKWTGIILSKSPPWLTSLIVDGIIGGVGLVLSFVPLMFFLYFFLALLEESGYMARVAFVMDKLMKGIGLHGKSFVPMVIGFGCNVPAIYATRALEDEKARKITALLIPYMSCGARLPIYALFTAVFFRHGQAGVVLSLYVFGIAVAVIVGLILKKAVFKGKAEEFLMELPPYRVPTLKMIWSSMWLRTRAFVIKAGTIIFITMIFLWALINIPYGAPPEKTILGVTARTIAPIFKPAGFGDKWQAVAALIPGTIAKEAVVGALGQAYGAGEEEEGKEEKSSFWEDSIDQIKGFFVAIWESLKSLATWKSSIFEMEVEESPLLKKIKNAFTPLSSYSYMVFTLLWIPCIVTLGAIYQEFGWGILGFSILLTTLVPYIASTLVFSIGKFLGF